MKLSSFLPREIRLPVEKYAHLRALSRRKIIEIALITILGVAVEAFGIGMLYPIITFVEQGSDIAKLSAESELWRFIVKAFALFGLPVNLVTLSGTVLFLITFRQVTSYFLGIAIERERFRIGRDLSVRTFLAIIGARSRHIQSFSTGEFSYLINTLCQSSGSLVRCLADLGGKTLTIACYGLIMFNTAPGMTLIAGTFGLIILLSVGRYVRFINQISRNSILANESFTKHLSESFLSWRLIKLSNALGYERGIIFRNVEDLFRLNLRQTIVSGRLMLIILPMSVAFALTTLYLAVEVFRVDLALMALFFVILFRIMPLIESISKQRQTIALIDAMLDRVIDAQKAAFAEREELSGTIEFTTIKDAIRFDNVSFAYPGNPKGALRNLTATIPANRMTAIIGPSGAGKSTLVDMIPRLLVPTEGRVMIDDTPAGELKLTSLRSQIQFVNQSPLILNTSVIDNIRYARQDLSIEEVYAACKLAHAHEFIEKLPDGYNTILGEGGFRLSGGQRQRIALARAFIKRQGILVLDEPTSALDYGTEIGVRDSLNELVRTGTMTIIIIAHRFSTIRDANHVIALNDGQLVHCGRPEDLADWQQWLEEEQTYF